MVAEIFGVTGDGDAAIVAAHRSGGADFPLWAVDLDDGAVEPVLPDADFVLSASVANDGSIVAFDGSAPTRLVVAAPTASGFEDGREVGSFDLVAESGATWIGDDAVVLSGARLGEEADLYLIDIDTGHATNLTNTPTVFESSPTLVDGGRSGPVIAYISASVVGASDVPDHGPTTVATATVVDDHLEGADDGLDLRPLDGLTLAVIRSCATGGCLVAEGFREDHDRHEMWCVGADTRQLDLPDDARSPVVLPDGQVVVIVGGGTLDRGRDRCG